MKSVNDEAGGRTGETGHRCARVTGRSEKPDSLSEWYLCDSRLATAMEGR